MQIAVFSIQKNNDEYKALNDKYAKLISHFAEFKDFYLFNAKINAAQKQGQSAAWQSYAQHLKPHKKGFCVILHERGKELTSLEFAKLLQDKNELSFFIGGAFGFEESFVSEFDFVLSLSRLTLAHHLVKIMLLEQIYRGFCINHKHPYHK